MIHEIVVGDDIEEFLWSENRVTEQEEYLDDGHQDVVLDVIGVEQTCETAITQDRVFTLRKNGECESDCEY